MGIERIELVDTGIYQTDRVRVTGSADMRDYFKALAESNDPANVAADTAAFARAVLERHDAESDIGENARSLLFYAALLHERFDSLDFARLVVLREHVYAQQFEPDAMRGRLILAGSRLGHERTHGTESEKTARRAAVLATWNRLRLENPIWSARAVNEATAKSHGLSTKTVQRYRSKS